MKLLSFFLKTYSQNFSRFCRKMEDHDYLKVLSIDFSLNFFPQNWKTWTRMGTKIARLSFSQNLLIFGFVFHEGKVAWLLKSTFKKNWVKFELTGPKSIEKWYVCFFLKICLLDIFEFLHGSRGLRIPQSILYWSLQECLFCPSQGEKDQNYPKNLLLRFLFFFMNVEGYRYPEIAMWTTCTQKYSFFSLFHQNLFIRFCNFFL